MWLNIFPLIECRAVDSVLNLPDNLSHIHFKAPGRGGEGTYPRIFPQMARFILNSVERESLRFRLRHPAALSLVKEYPC